MPFPLLAQSSIIIAKLCSQPAHQHPCYDRLYHVGSQYALFGIARASTVGNGSTWAPHPTPLVPAPSPTLTSSLSASSISASPILSSQISSRRGADLNCRNPQLRQARVPSAADGVVASCQAFCPRGQQPDRRFVSRALHRHSSIAQHAGMLVYCAMCNDETGGDRIIVRTPAKLKLNNRSPQTRVKIL